MNIFTIISSKEKLYFYKIVSIINLKNINNLFDEIFYYIDRKIKSFWINFFFILPLRVEH